MAEQEYKSRFKAFKETRESIYRKKRVSTGARKQEKNPKTQTVRQLRASQRPLIRNSCRPYHFPEGGGRILPRISERRAMGAFLIRP